MTGLNVRPELRSFLPEILGLLQEPGGKCLLPVVEYLWGRRRKRQTIVLEESFDALFNEHRGLEALYLETETNCACRYLEKGNHDISGNRIMNRVMSLNPNTSNDSTYPSCSTVLNWLKAGSFKTCAMRRAMARRGIFDMSPN